MIKTSKAHRFVKCSKKSACSLVALSAGLFAMSSAQAFEIKTDNPDFRILWDTTAKYSVASRLEDQNPLLIADTQGNWPNTDDGNRNFNKGLISNRLDVLTEMDIIYKRKFGFRASAAAWYDSIYQGKNDADSESTNNNASVAYNEFTDDTATLHGGDVELLDAFVFGKFVVGGRPASFRLGRHTVLWGETMFLGANGIANAMAPINVVKAQSVPNTQFKELMRPVGQFSGQVQLTSNVTIGAFYQYEWEKTLLPGAGSYFSGVDFLSEGGERMLLAPDGSAFFTRTSDIEAEDSGQGGVKLKFRTENSDWGLYAIQYHEKAPVPYVLPGADQGPTDDGFQVGYYRWVYPQNVKTLGASVNRTFGNVNLAAEVSIRKDTPLSADAAPDVTATGDNDSNILYPVGDSQHANMSWFTSFGPSFIAKEATMIGEVAWNNVTEVTKNEAIVNPNATDSATNIRVIYEPAYRQVVPGLDLGVPFGIGYGLDGNSKAVGAFLGEDIGDVSIGLTGTYLDSWRVGANYTHYFGDADNVIDSAGHGSYKQSLADRDFVSLSIRRTF